jgi:hypothetical protein
LDTRAAPAALSKETDMGMDMHELEAESAELLPGREALGKLSISFTKTVDITKHVNVANVGAENVSSAANYHSFGATALSQAEQGISVSQS